jgi:hypothetical protein
LNLRPPGHERRVDSLTRSRLAAKTLSEKPLVGPNFGPKSNLALATILWQFIRAAPSVLFSAFACLLYTHRIRNFCCLPRRSKCRRCVGNCPYPSTSIWCLTGVNLMRFGASRNRSASECVKATVFSLLLAATPAFACDHASEYQVGVLPATGQLSDGSVALCNGRRCPA